MKYKFLLFTIITIAITALFSSCGAMLYGTSSDVTLKKNEGMEDNVNIIAVGPKKVLEYKNVSLPYKMKVKHNNFPLQVQTFSSTNIYEPFTIEGTEKGETLSAIGGFTALGLSFAAAVGGFVTIFTPALAYPTLGALGGMFGAFGITATIPTDVPEKKLYLASSMPKTEINKYLGEEWWVKQSFIQDIYTFINKNKLEEAETLTNWLLDKEKTGELYYLRGLIHYRNDKLKKAREDILVAQTMVNVKNNPGLYDDITASLQAIDKARQLKREERIQMWSEVAGMAIQVGVATYQSYEQAKYFNNLQKSGITPSGVVTDPSKLSQAQLNQLIDPRFAAQQVMQKEYLEYQEFSRFNKKADGSNYSFDEYWTLKGQALLDLKEQGVDLVAEQREQNAKARQEWRESLDEDRKQRLNKLGVDTSNMSNTSNTTSSQTSSSSITINSSSSYTSNALNKDLDSNQKVEEDIDSKEQYKSKGVSSDDYHFEKHVTLYIRDANTNRVKFSNKDLCKKGASYYVKIDDMYYLVQVQGGWGFNSSILWGTTILYFNK